MRAIGRGLQLVGLIALPVGCFLELTGGLGLTFGLSQLIFTLSFGVIAFVLGRYLEGYART
jgi:hypothetical protein